jgi:DNA-binding LytR/AlgR family response regulator
VLSAQVSGRPAQYLSWLQASVGQTLQLVPVEDVLYCVSDEKYTRVQTAKQEFLIRKPIKELVEALDPTIFWQIHRSTLVNVRAIAGVLRDERGRQEVLVKGRSEKLQVSRSAAQLFRSM